MCGEVPMQTVPVQGEKSSFSCAMCACKACLLLPGENAPVGMLHEEEEAKCLRWQLEEKAAAASMQEMNNACHAKWRDQEEFEPRFPSSRQQMPPVLSLSCLSAAIEEHVKAGRAQQGKQKACMHAERASLPILSPVSEREESSFSDAPGIRGNIAA